MKVTCKHIFIIQNRINRKKLIQIILNFYIYKSECWIYIKHNLKILKNPLNNELVFDQPIKGMKMTII